MQAEESEKQRSQSQPELEASRIIKVPNKDSESSKNVDLFHVLYFKKTKKNVIF